VELSADAIVELFRKDVRARRELAVLLVSEPEVRLAIINAVLRDVATKGDIERLRESLENRFEQHRAATKSDMEALRAAVKDDIKVLKEDMERRFEELRTEFRRELDSVRREIDMLAREIDRLYRLVMVSVLGILISVATTILVRVLLP
jgi:ketosteroid isomerase-like protein